VPEVPELATVGDFYQYALERGRIAPFVGPVAADALAAMDFRGKADHDLAGSAGFRNILYGAEVMDHIYREVNLFSIWPQGNMVKSGMRVDIYDPSTRGYGGGDGGTVGTALANDINEVAVSPGYVHTPWNETLAAQVESQIDDGVPLAAYNRERFKRIHLQLLNALVTINAESAAANATANTTDAKASNDTTAANRGLGIDALDRIISADAEEDQKGGSFTGWYDIWQNGAVTTLGDRDSGTDADAQVVPQSGTHGTDAALSLAKLDEVLRLTEEQGAIPDQQIIATGRATYDTIKDRVGPQWRIEMEERNVQASIGTGLSLSPTGTKPGPNVTFRVRSYEGRPFVLQKGMPADGSPRAYVVHMPDFKWEWIVPTLFLDGGSNFVLLNYIGNKSLYLSGGRFVASNVRRSGKLTDLL
jgi:hypothetical protein